MKEIKLSKYGKNRKLNLTTLVDDSDFEWLNQWNWFAKYAKNIHSYYACRHEFGTQKIIYMHRFILGLKDKINGDHINHNTLDNTRKNIRIATSRQNSYNRKPHINSSSKFLGVCWFKNKWLAQIQVNGKSKYLGYFTKEQDAAFAYNNAAIEFFKEFANLNKMTG